ncbi:MAG: phage terminase small subunit [Lachnospiraceae bacterium]
MNKWDLAFEDYQKGLKYKQIAEKYDVTLNTVKSWKTRYWNKKGVHTKDKKVCTQKGAQPKNKNATGPPGNKNAEKHGLFAKYLPQETLDIVSNMSMDPLDILWDQIQIAYAAIVRAQQIMYVKDKDDKTKAMTFDGVTGTGYEVQQAWDKQANFLKAQARAQSELRSLVKQYNELGDTEEQKLRIQKLQYEITQMSGNKDALDKLDEILEEVRADAVKSETEELHSECEPPLES